jgi:hypothetical protein
MQPLAVDLRLMRDVLLPDVKLGVGRSLMARVVAADAGGRGSLSIAGYLLDAELPENVLPGQELRLTVREITAHRVLLGIGDPGEEAAPGAGAPAQATPEAPAPPPPLVDVPLPGGGALTVNEQSSQPGGEGGEGSHTVAMTYDAPAIGPVGLRFQYARGAVRVEVSVAGGDAYARADAAAPALRAALSAALEGGAANVRIIGRREPLDLYA